MILKLCIIVKVTIVDVLLPKTLIRTLITQDDLNLELYLKKQSDSGHVPPIDLRFLCMLLVSECINYIQEGDVKNQKL